MRTRILWPTLLAGLLSVVGLWAHEPITRARTDVKIPDVPGFLTLKCDLHIHTVFSDGLVWPSVRTMEAWLEGLDAIAITDHIEYQPHKQDVSTNHNRAFEIAQGASGDLDVLVIRGSEITRKMPPGHLNAIFLTNSAMLAVSNWEDSVKAAVDQQAFIFWNHPGWEAQITNNLVVWYPEHTRLLEQGRLHGIEVVNGRSYYPEAHKWAIEKKLTLLSNSDIHSPLNLDYHVHDRDHRPITLVFARERTARGIKEALFNRRTAVYTGSQLIGDELFLKPIFARSVTVKNPQVTIKGKQRAYARVYNNSEVDFKLERAEWDGPVAIPKVVTLAAGKTILLDVRGKGTAKGRQRIELPYAVQNLLIGPDQPLQVKIALEVDFN